MSKEDCLAIINLYRWLEELSTSHDHRGELCHFCHDLEKGRLLAQKASICLEGLLWSESNKVA